MYLQFAKYKVSHIFSAETIRNFTLVLKIIINIPERERERERDGEVYTYHRQLASCRNKLDDCLYLDMTKIRLAFASLKSFKTAFCKTNRE